MKVAFIVSKFPCYDEAFILRELYGLSKEMDMVISSLRKSEETMIHDEARELLSKTFYIPYFFSVKVQWAQVLMLFKHPVKYVRTFIKVLIGNLKSPEFLFKSLIFFPKSVYLANWFEENKITHIHAYWATYPATAAFIASKITGIPFSFTGHAHDIYLDTTFLRRKMLGAMFVTTCTKQNKNHLLKIVRHYPERKILVNYHGLELEKFHVNGKERNKIFEILSVGTLQDHKGFQYLISALALLKERALNFTCTIIGGGPLESDLRKHIRLLNLESSVVMTGPLKQSEVLPYYQKADLLILMAQPEWHWGIPNVLIEALAAKTPVITTKFGSVEELVQDGVTGLIVPPKDPKALADQVEKLYREDFFRKKLAEAGHQLIVENFSLEKNIRVFQKALAHEDAALLN